MDNISIFSIEGVDAREICNAQLGDVLFAPCSVCDKWRGDYPSVDNLFYGYVEDDIFYNYSDEECAELSAYSTKASYNEENV